MRLSALQILMAGLVICIAATPAFGITFADSAAEFTTTGTQGENDWFSGYYNLTLDQNVGDGIYQPGDLTLFNNLAGPGGGPVAPGGNHWNGTQWDLQPGAPGPWTELGANTTHPNGTNSAPNEEQWTIRRWVSDVEARVDVTWTTAKANPNATGVTGLLYLNGTLLDQATIAGNDLVGVNNTLTSLLIGPGDTFDLALSPLGIGGDRSDGSDGSTNSLFISGELVPEPATFALGVMALFALAGCGWRRRVQR